MAVLTRSALSTFAEIRELRVPPTAPDSVFAPALRAAATEVDCVFDLSTLVRCGRLAPRLPLLLWALGNLPRGAGLLSGRRSELKSTDSLLVNCNADLEIYRRTLGESGLHARLLPFSVDTERFHPLDPAERLAARRSLAVPAETLVLVYAGRINVQKNLHTLLYLLAELRRSGQPVLLLIAGAADRTPFPEFGVSNDDYQRQLAALAVELGLGPSVRFLGELDDADLARCLGAGDLFVSLSLHHDENFGFGPVEAMAAGLPALVSDWGGYRDSVRHGETGARIPTFFTSHGVRVAWRRALPWLRGFLADASSRKRNALRARQHALARYAPPVLAAALAQELSDAIDRRDQPPRFGNESFRFHPLALKLQARNALMHLVHERSGAPFDLRVGPDDYDVYRFFVAPYATLDVSAHHAAAADHPQLLQPVLPRGAVLECQDPVWPASHELGPELALLFAAVDGKRSLAGLAADHGLPVTTVLEAATRLARAGVIDLGQGIESLPPAANPA